LQNAVNGVVYTYMPPLLLAYHSLYNVGYDDRIQNRPHYCRGPAKVSGSKAKPASQVNAVQSKQSEGQSDTKGAQ
jgi:hypothetical protein